VAATRKDQIFEDIIKTIREPLLVLDQDLRVVTVSRSFYDFFKVKPEETVGQLIYDLGNKQWDIPKLRELLETILPKKTAFDNYEVEHDFATIGRRIMLLNARQIERAMGKERIILLAIEDITERKQAEEERKQLQDKLQQSQKMETIGTLAGGIAHDYNNLLAAIMGNLSMAQEESAPHSVMAELLHEAEQASLKARDLTHQFLTLSQGGHPVKNLGSIGNLLKEIPEQVQVHDGIEYAFSIQNDLWPVEYDPRQIEHTITSLLMNAVEAMPQGGCINIRAENQVIDNKDKEFPLVLNEGKYVTISIKDEGSGISEDHMDKIFDPYFSTKDRGTQKGMGMGLAVAQAVVQKHDGHIMINSTTGVGTTVTVYLPAECAERRAQSAERCGMDSQSTIANQQSSIQRVLVMDDEESLRNLAQRMLERLGYRVETVKDGLEAIEAYKKQKDSVEPFDAVILDLTIKGGMGGEQTIRELIKIDPGVKPKPYQIADLEIVLKKVLR